MKPVTGNRLILLGALVALPLLFASYKRSAHASETVAATPSHRLYTAYNLWYEKQDLSSINYQKGALIPAGTGVSSVVVVAGRKPEIKFTTAKGEAFAIGFIAKYHPGLSAEGFKNRLFTSKPFDDLVKGMTAEEIKAIKAGEVKVGMSRKAVLAAFGYPPEHVTPSLERSEWTYWKDRYRKALVHFDDKGNVIGPLP